MGHVLPFYIQYAAHFNYDGIWLDLEHRNMDEREVQQGFLEVPGRTGGVEKHRLMSVTVAAVGGYGQRFEHAADLSTRAAELKRHSKHRARNGERGAGSHVSWERRGTR